MLRGPGRRPRGDSAPRAPAASSSSTTTSSGIIRSLLVGVRVCFLFVFTRFVEFCNDFWLFLFVVSLL